MAGISVALEPKTSTFQMRISPKVKAQAEKIFSNCGMTLTDAINAFIQQSINVEGMPFLITQNGKDAVRSLALAQLMLELQKGEESAKEGMVAENDLAAQYGVKL